jgi:hypothetical protein
MEQRIRLSARHPPSPDGSPMMTIPTTPTRLPGDTIPPPPEPRYPWRVGVTMLGLLVLVLVVVWLAFLALKGPQTSSEFPSPATATAYARAFQATVAAADTAEPRPTRQATAASVAQPTAVPRRVPVVLPPPAAAAATPQVATTVPAPAAQPPTTAAVAASAPTPAPTQAAAPGSQTEPVRTATAATVRGDQSATGSPVPTVAPDLEQAISDAYLGKYWQARADALYSLDPAPLQDVAAGPELARLQQRIEDDKAQGRATLVKTQHTFAVSWAHDGEAQVVDRYADMSIWVDATTHELLPGQVEPSVDAAPVHKVIDNIQFINGTWKVTDGVEVVDGEAP